MGGGEFRSSLLRHQQMVWSTDSKNMLSSRGLMPCAAAAEEQEEEEEGSSNKMPPSLSSPAASSMLLPGQHHLLHQISSAAGLLPLPPEVLNLNGSSSATASSDLHDGRESNMPESWSQLLLGGLVGDHERYNAATALLSKGLEDEGPATAMPAAAAAAYNFYGHGHGGSEEILTSGTNSNKSHQVSQQTPLLASSSPRSCITTSLGSNNMLDFANTAAVPAAPEQKNHQSDNSSEGNSTASGSAPKKARVQTSSSAQSTLKETIGYIRFLLSQIEALSFPYLGHCNGNSMQQHSSLLLNNHSTSNGMVEIEGPTLQQQEEEVNGVDENGISRKDLRSRGLCLVPVSCTSHLADDNGGASDFWAVAAAPPPPPLAGIIWR